MNFTELLTPKICACGKTHTCAIRHVVIEEGAIEKIPSLCTEYHHILLVADNNTFFACGNEVTSLLGARIESTVVFRQEGVLVPNEDAIAKAQAALTKETDLIIGIGSGVIQDLCKYVSFKASLPYHIVATAPSMDGYASRGAAMIIGNMKVTYDAHVPDVIVGDTRILKDAPMDLIKSGYGDILGKYSCLNDWKLSRVINDEYFCPYVYDLTFSMLDKVKDLGPRLLARESEAIGILMEALVGVGIAMAFVGNSRPASGSEHHLSHFFEVTGLLDGTPYFLHGIDVVYSAVYTTHLREALLAIDTPTAGDTLSKQEYEEKIRAIYTDAADGVIALQRKLGMYEKISLPRITEKWQEIKAVLTECPTSDTLLSYLASIDLPIEDFEGEYGKEKIQNALYFAKDLKDRYSVLWLYFALCYRKNG